VTHTSIDGLACTPNTNCSIKGICKDKQCVSSILCECEEDADCPALKNKCDGTIFCDKSGAAPTCNVKPGTQVECAAPAECMGADCVAKTGKCQTYFMVDTTSCDDGNLCTENDQCSLSQCKGSKKDCNDGDDCTSDSCGANGCVNTPIPGCGDPPEDCDDPVAGNVCVKAEATGDAWLEFPIFNNGKKSYLIVAKHKCYDKKRSLLKFGLDKVPVDQVVLKAEMMIWYSYHHQPSQQSCKEPGIDRVIAVHEMLRAWDEGTVTKSTASQGVFWDEEMVGMNDIDAAAFSTDEQLWELDSTGWKSFDITPLVKKWMATPATNYGVLMWATNETEDGHDMRMHSREFNEADKRPHLKIVLGP
jgi:hypothetical protein